MHGVLRWHQLETIWHKLSADEGWYLYEIGRNLPEERITAYELQAATREIDDFLHQEHDADFCGLVYTDNLDNPSLLKIYHPKKMGASCGSSRSTVLPKWTLSKMPPIDLIEWSLQKNEKPAWWKHMLKKSA